MNKLMIVAGLSLLVAGCKPGAGLYPGHSGLVPGDTVQSVHDRFVARSQALDQQLQRQHDALVRHYTDWNNRIVAAYQGLPATNQHYEAELARCEGQFDAAINQLDWTSEVEHQHLQADWDATTEALENVQR